MEELYTSLGSLNLDDDDDSETGSVSDVAGWTRAHSLRLRCHELCGARRARAAAAVLAVALAALITTLIVCLPSHVRRTHRSGTAMPTAMPTASPTALPTAGGDVALSIVFVETGNKRLARVDISPGERASPIAPVMTLRDGLTSPKDVAVLADEGVVVWSEMGGGEEGSGGVYRASLSGGGARVVLASGAGGWVKPALIALDPVERTVYFTSQATADKSDGYVIRSCALDAAPGAGASPPPAPVLAQVPGQPMGLALAIGGPNPTLYYSDYVEATLNRVVLASDSTSAPTPIHPETLLCGLSPRPKYVRVAPGVEGRGDALHLVQQDTTTRASQIVAIDIHALERLSCAASGCNASGGFAPRAADGAAGRDGVSDELRAIARIVVGAKDAGYPDGIAHGCGGHDLWSSDKYGGSLNRFIPRRGEDPEHVARNLSLPKGFDLVCGGL